MPNSACSSPASAAARCSSRTGATSSMYGRLVVELEAVGDPLAQHATARRAGSDSRNLIFRFIADCIFGERGVAEMLRPPSARGPNSMRP